MEMKLNDFDTDLEYSLSESENEMFDRFYYRVFPALEKIEVVDDLERQLQGIDKVLHFRNGKAVLIDEKKRRTDYGDIIIEIWSNTEKKKAGWVFKPMTDYVVYAVMPSKKCYLLPSLLLKIWVKRNWNNLSDYKKVVAKNTGYTTTSYAVPTQKLLNDLRMLMTQQLC
jgi:hypothetical protein